MSKSFRADGPGCVFHITSRVNWRAWHLDVDSVKATLAELTAAAACEFGVVVLAYVLMDNHFHLVVWSPPAALFRKLTSRRTACRHRRPWPPGHQNASVLAQFMRKIRTSMSRKRHRELGVSGHFWEGRYDARMVDSPLSLAVRIAYDHRNPVKAGMVATPEDYRWSSARTWVQGGDSDIPLDLARLPFDADPASLHRNVLLYQRTPELDGADGLTQLLRSRACTSDGIRHELEQAGIPIQVCGTRAAV
ncbi:MAG: transposase [Planctomycetota bacterium]|jgi:REP element-mobilizing transposase RayT